MRLLSSSIALVLIPLLAVLPISAEINDTNPDTPTAKSGALQIRLLDSGSTAVPVDSTGADGYTIQVTDSMGQPVADAAVAVRLPEEGPSGTFPDGSRAAVGYTDSNGQAKLPQIRWGSVAGTAQVRVTVAKGGVHAGALIEQVINAGATPAAPVPASSAPARVPGTPKSAAPGPLSAARSGAGSADIPGATAAAAPPSVSVTNTATGKDLGAPVRTGGSTNTSNKKLWILLAVVAAGAGVGAAMALGGHSATTVASVPTLTIGTPTLSVGH